MDSVLRNRLVFDVFQVLPVSFWAAVTLIVVGVCWALKNLRQGLGLPVLAVLGTTTAWYIGDVFYNDYAQNHARNFPPAILDAAWWQVSLFLAAFLVLARIVHKRVNRSLGAACSEAWQIFQSRVTPPGFEAQLRWLNLGCLALWCILSLIAAIRLRSEVVYYFFPFLAYKADPWGRGQIGSGFSALLSLAAYLHLFAASAFGVVAALARDWRTRAVALSGCLVTWPYFFFDRTRNLILVVLLPALLSWVFLRLRGSLLTRFSILVVCFIGVHFWFKFVIANRATMSIVAAVRDRLDSRRGGESRHEGLNMFEELCWINYLMRDGSYAPNWGQRYFAEVVNPIPRALWRNKPTIGLDYAVARGQSVNDDYTVNGTISTGMIGQGVVNFGRVFGPIFAAFLLSLWVSLLARLDLHGRDPGNLLLFVLGLVLTFNLGRDITLITLYTFCFGWAVVWIVRYFRQQPLAEKATRRSSPERNSRRVRSMPRRGGIDEKARLDIVR